MKKPSTSTASSMKANAAKTGAYNRQRQLAMNKGRPKGYSGRSESPTRAPGKAKPGSKAYAQELNQASAIIGGGSDKGGGKKK